MSIKFRMYQDNRSNSKHKGYWYARAISPDLVGVKDLANRVSARCTVTEPDILAVISALVFEMNQVPKAGNRVKLDGLGTFRVGIHSSGVEKAKDFNPQRDIFGAHVIFVPCGEGGRFSSSCQPNFSMVCVCRRPSSMTRLSLLPSQKKTSKKGGKDKTSTPSAGPVAGESTPTGESHA